MFFEPHLRFTPVDDLHTRIELDVAGRVRGVEALLYVRRRGEIDRYQIVAPTTWNFSPRDGAGVPGPLESALVDVGVGKLGAKAAIIQHVVRSFDPCMV